MDAISAVTELGMVFSNKELEDIISSPLDETGDCGNDEDNDDDGDGDDDSAEVHQDEKGMIYNEDLLNDISVMQKAGVIDERACDTAQKTFKRIDNNTVLLYMKIDCGKKQQQRKFSPFVEVNHNGKAFHIRKSTAVWLFQECERVSIDHLFRVRSKQPYSSSNELDSLQGKSCSPQVSTLPTKLQSIQIGDICVFKTQGKWKIGKVQQFFYPEGKTQKARQCSQTVFNLTTISKDVGAVCSWFSWHPPLSLQTFSLGIDDRSLSQSCSIVDYAFTLSDECFQLLQMEKPVDSAPQGILMNDSVNTQLMCAKLITLSNETLSFIEENLQITTRLGSIFQADSTSICKVKPESSGAATVNVGNKSNIIWKKYGCFLLTNLHKAHLCTDHLLDDIHIGAAQELIKKKFPHFGGLQNTVMQNSETLKSLNSKNGSLQIVHVKLGKVDHWVLISTVGCAEDEIELYDSLQQKPSLDTQTVIARYLRSSSQSIRIKLINVALQKGSIDCGLYAIAMMTSIAHKQDPEYVVYDQKELRLHLKECFDKGSIEPFPISKKRRLKNRILMEEICLIYCVCRLPEPDDGSEMVQCDGCMEWYHQKCLNDLPVPLEELDNWLCDKCQCDTATQNH